MTKIKFKTVKKFESFSEACLWARKEVRGLTLKKYSLSWDVNDNSCEVTVYGPHVIKTRVA